MNLKQKSVTVIDRVWKQPSQKEQDDLRRRIIEYLDKIPTACKVMASRASVTSMTLLNFMKGKNLEWVSWKKIDNLMKKLDKG